MMRYLHSLLWPILAQSSVFACSLDIYDHTVSASSDEVVIRLTGGSSAPESYRAPIVTREGNRIEIGFESPAPGTNCFASPLPWSHAVVVSDLGAGSHDVVVTRDSIEIHVFAFDWPVVHDPSMPGAGFSPSAGMWWSSEAPGTGVAFNIDNQGRWFAAIYLYETDGRPTFLTMQGEKLFYDIYADPSEPYATASSPLIRSEGGHCLQCPWTPAVTTDTGEIGQLSFLSRTHGTLTVNDWSLDLTLLPEVTPRPFGHSLPLADRHYILMLDGPDERHILVVKVRQGGGFTGTTSRVLECIDCRSVDVDGEASDSLDAALMARISTMAFSCTPGRCRFVTGSDDTTTRLFADQSGEIITVLAFDDAGETTRIEFRLLSEDWRP